MSRYSFIDENINTSGKQCFCIDVNSTNLPFINTNQFTVASSPVDAPLQNTLKKLDSYQTIQSDQSFLLSPQVIGASSTDREKKLIDTVNTLLTQVYTNVSNQKDIKTLDEQIIDIPKTSLTIDTNPKLVSKIDLNKMANDKKIGKKTYRKSSSNLNLFEGFQNNECNKTCTRKPSRERRTHRKKRNIRKKTSPINENFYLLIIIVLLLLCSWFKK